MSAPARTTLLSKMATTTENGQPANSYNFPSHSQQFDAAAATLKNCARSMNITHSMEKDLLGTNFVSKVNVQLLELERRVLDFAASPEVTQGVFLSVAFKRREGIFCRYIESGCFYGAMGEISKLIQASNPDCCNVFKYRTFTTADIVARHEKYILTASNKGRATGRTRVSQYFTFKSQLCKTLFEKLVTLSESEGMSNKMEVVSVVFHCVKKKAVESDCLDRPLLVHGITSVSEINEALKDHRIKQLCDKPYEIDFKTLKEEIIPRNVDEQFAILSSLSNYHWAERKCVKYIQHISAKSEYYLSPTSMRNLVIHYHQNGYDHRFQQCVRTLTGTVKKKAQKKMAALCAVKLAPKMCTMSTAAAAAAERKRSQDSQSGDGGPPKRSRLDLVIGKLGSQIGISPETMKCDPSDEDSRQCSDTSEKSEDNLSSVSEEEDNKTSQSSTKAVWISGKELEAVVRSKVSSYLKAHRDSKMDALRARVEELQAANETWKSQAKELQKQVLDLTVLQQRLEKRKAATAALRETTTRRVGIQSDDIKMNFATGQAVKVAIMPPTTATPATNMTITAPLLSNTVTTGTTSSTSLQGVVMMTQLAQRLSSTVLPSTLGNSLTSVRSLLDTSNTIDTISKLQTVPGQALSGSNVIVVSSCTLSTQAPKGISKIFDLTSDDDSAKRPAANELPEASGSNLCPPFNVVPAGSSVTTPQTQIHSAVPSVLPAKSAIPSVAPTMPLSKPLTFVIVRPVPRSSNMPPLRLVTSVNIGPAPVSSAMPTLKPTTSVASTTCLLRPATPLTIRPVIVTSPMPPMRTVTPVTIKPVTLTSPMSPSRTVTPVTINSVTVTSPMPPLRTVTPVTNESAPVASTTPLLRPVTPQTIRPVTVTSPMSPSRTVTPVTIKSVSVTSPMPPLRTVTPVTIESAPVASTTPLLRPMTSQTIRPVTVTSPMSPSRTFTPVTIKSVSVTSRMSPLRTVTPVTIGSAPVASTTPLLRPVTPQTIKPVTVTSPMPPLRTVTPVTIKPVTVTSPMPPLRTVTPVTIKSVTVTSPMSPSRTITPVTIKPVTVTSPMPPLKTVTPVTIKSVTVTSPMSPSRTITPVTIKPVTVTSPMPPLRTVTPVTIKSVTVTSPMSPSRTITPVTIKPVTVTSPMPPLRTVTPVTIGSAPVASPMSPSRTITPVTIKPVTVTSPMPPLRTVTPVTIGSAPVASTTPLLRPVTPQTIRPVTVTSPMSPSRTVTPVTIKPVTVTSPMSPLRTVTPVTIGSAPVASTTPLLRPVTPQTIRPVTVTSPMSPSRTVTPLTIRPITVTSPMPPLRTVTPLTIRPITVTSTMLPLRLVTPVTIRPPPVTSTMPPFRPATPVTIGSTPVISTMPLLRPETPVTIGQAVVTQTMPLIIPSVLPVAKAVVRPAAPTMLQVRAVTPLATLTVSAPRTVTSGQPPPPQTVVSEAAATKRIKSYFHQPGPVAATLRNCVRSFSIINSMDSALFECGFLSKANIHLPCMEMKALDLASLPKLSPGVFFSITFKRKGDLFCRFLESGCFSGSMTAISKLIEATNKDWSHMFKYRVFTPADLLVRQKHLDIAANKRSKAHRHKDKTELGVNVPRDCSRKYEVCKSLFDKLVTLSDSEEVRNKVEVVSIIFHLARHKTEVADWPLLVIPPLRMYGNGWYYSPGSIRNRLICYHQYGYEKKYMECVESLSGEPNI